MDLSNINKKMLKYIIIIVVVFVAFLVILGVVKLVIGTKLSYQKIEDKMKSAAMSYIKDDKADVALPEGDEILTISVDDLVSNKKMKDLSKYIKDDDVSCSGNVVVRKQDDDYMYIPYLDCGEAYTTQTLSDYIVNNVEQVNAGDGLYFMNNEYVYRGEYVDNYVKFANQVWRIVKIDANGNIKLLQDTATKNKNSWDNRYNVDFKSTVGINDYS